MKRIRTIRVLAFVAVLATVALVFVSFFLFGGRQSLASAAEWFSSLKLELKLTVVAIVFGVFIGLPQILITTGQLFWSLYEGYRNRAGASFPYKLLKPPDLYSFFYIPRERLEAHVARGQLRKLWGERLIPNDSRIIFHGKSNVGKTREAIEAINRISKAYNPEVAYAKYRAKEPAARPAELPNRDVILFVDDLALEGGARIEQDGETVVVPGAGRELQSAVEFFERECHSVKVILTMQTQQFEALRSSCREFVEQFQVIHLEELAKDEKRNYIEGLVKQFGCRPADPSLCERLAESSDETLSPLYELFNRLKEQGRQEFGADDVALFESDLQDGWKVKVELHLSPSERAIFGALSCLRQFEIEPSVPVVKRLFFRMRRQELTPLRRAREFDRVLRHLAHRQFTVRNGTVHCADYKLALKPQDDPGLASDLSMLADAVLDLARPGFWRRRELSVSESVEFLNVVTRRLNRYGMPGRAVDLASVALELSPREKIALFQKGLALNALDPDNPVESEVWLRRALEVDPANQYASHALASLFWKHGRAEEALALLEAALVRAPKDLATLNLRLGILSDLRPYDAATAHAYRALRRLIKKGDADTARSLHAEATCARLLAARRKPGERGLKRIEKAAEWLRTLVEKAPPDSDDLKAAAYHALGRLLYDEMGQPDQAIHYLRLAIDYGSHRHSAQKLASIFIAEAEAHPEERETYLRQAESYLSQTLRFNPKSFHARLSRAKLQSVLRDWLVIPVESYWDEVLQVQRSFGDALMPEETTRLRLHNSHVHHAAASFLWHAEFVARRRGIPKPEGLAGADAEFRRALESEADFGESPPASVRRHLALVYLTFGQYLMVTGGKNEPQREESKRYVERAFDLSRHGTLGINLLTGNAHVDNFVGSLFFQSGEYDKARRHLESSLMRWGRNPAALWLLGQVAEREGDLPGALRYFEQSADMQKSPNQFGKIRSLRRRWVNEAKIAHDPEEDLRIARKAFKLDPDGDIDPQHIARYAYDIYARAVAARDAAGLAEAKEMFVKAAQMLRARGKSFEAGLALWRAGECVSALSRRVDAESAALYIESAKVQDTETQLFRACRKVVRLRPAEAVGCLLDLAEEGFRTDEILSELATYCEHHEFTLPAPLLGRLEAVTNAHPESVSHERLSKFVGCQKGTEARLTST